MEEVFSNIKMFIPVHFILWDVILGKGFLETVDGLDTMIVGNEIGKGVDVS